MTPTKNESLPELPVPHSRRVIANGHNTPAVAKGYEVGGYEVSPDLYTADQMHAYALAALTREAPPEAVGEVSRARGIIGDIINGECSVAALQDAHDLLTTALLPTILPTTPPAPQRMAQGEDDRASAILSDVLGIDAGRIAWGRGEGLTVSIEDALTAVNMALTTQPPHQDRGEASKFMHDMLLDWRAAASIGRPITGDEIWEFEQRMIAALTEAKQQGAGEAVAYRYRTRSTGEPEWSEWAYESGNATMYEMEVYYTELNAFYYEAEKLYTAPQVEAKRQTGEGE